MSPLAALNSDGATMSTSGRSHKMRTKGLLGACPYALQLKKGRFMKAVTCALAASFLTIVCAPAFAAHGGATEKAGYVQKADNKESKNYSVARNGADDKNHDEFDDHGGW
jgi:hypothetical protein